MADGLQVAEGVLGEIDGRAFLEQLSAAVLGQHQGHGVEQHRRRARQLVVGLQQGAVHQPGPAALGRDDLDRGAGRLGRLLHRLDHGAVGPVGDQDRDLPPFQGVGIFADDAQGGRGGQVDRFGRCGVLVGQDHAQAVGHPLGQVFVNIAQVAHHADAHMLQRHLRQLEDDSRGQVRLFWRLQAAEEQPGVAVVVGEGLGAQPHLLPLHGRAEAGEAALGVGARAAFLAGLGQAVGLIVGPAGEHLGLHVAVALEVLEGAALGPVDRDLVEIHRPQPRQLGVLIGEQPPLQQRVFRKVEARHDVGRQEGGLFGLGEEVVGVAVQRQAPDHLQRMRLLGDQFGRVQDVEGQGVGLGLGQDLHGEIPFGEVALVDGVEQVAAVIIRVGPGDLDRLVPAGRLRAQPGPPVEFDEVGLALGVDQSEGVDAEPLDHAERAGNGAVRHGPHHHVGALGHQADEVPEGVVRAGRLGIAAIGLHLHRVDQVGEFDRVLDEEDRDVVPHQVPVALLGIELHREAAHVARRVDRAGAAGHRGEADEDLGLLADLGQHLGGGVGRQALGQFEDAVRGRSAGVDDALGDAFVVEMLDLLAQDEVFQQRRAARAAAQGVLVVAERRPVVGGQPCFGRRGLLLQFAPIAPYVPILGLIRHGALLICP
ncbi:hypothetical protein D3C77_199870 [compost metagenome]